jgi:pyridoxal 5'-phosphate synthase pdxT subunit
VDGKIGILALQGGFYKHEMMLSSIGVTPIQIRYPIDLERCIGLILPGGESTTMTLQIKKMGFLEPLLQFAKKKPIFGTCAGMILMSRKGILNLLDISVERNAYGKQCSSFSVDLRLPFSEHVFPALFIRAPKITAIQHQTVAILSSIGDEPVLVQQNKHLAASFHPELTNVSEIHKYFIELCKSKQSPPLPLKITPTKSFQMI